MNGPLLLSYAGCDTCKKALRWLNQHGVAVTVRPIVDQPPTAAELARWVPSSGLPVRKWLNTSGKSYRALGKEQVEAASDATLLRWLAADGKLVKRPVLVSGNQVFVGFREEQYEALFSC
ncbi:MAG TPA: Spx/MgsR family RNA polymerase-binding regulatory protein [Pseudomonadota bacterium]|nr:Spx/MgsR family RNA polymerase-binding regulatory protein [Pseudomonadota bacterium]